MPDPTEETFFEEVLEAPVIPHVPKPAKKILKKPKKYAKEYKDRVKAAKESDKISTLPPPPAYKMKGDNFFTWIASFTTEEIGRAEFRFYRDWPVVDLKLIDQRSEKCFLTLRNEGLPFAPQDWEQSIYDNQEWGGSGSYRVLCNETGVKQQVGWTSFTLDDVIYPPRVDPRSLVVGHPNNQGYIASLRARGMRMPGDDPSLDLTDKKEQEEMEVLTKVMENHEKETDRLHEQIDELQDKLTEKRTESPDNSVLAGATSEAVKVIGEGARAAINIVSQQAREVSQASAPNFDPIGLVKTGVELARAGQTGDNGVGVIVDFLKIKAQQDADEAKYWRDKFFEKQEVTTEAQIPKPFIDQIRDIKEVAETLGFTRGRRESNGDSQPAASSEPAKASWYETLGEKLAENPAMAITGVALLTNLVQSFMGKGKAPEVVMAEAKQLADTMTGGGTPVATTAQPTQQDRQAIQNAQYEAFMKMITPLFKRHYFDEKGEGLSGFTFAAEYLTMHESPAGGVGFMAGGEETDYGREQYNQVKAIGFQRFDQTLRNWPGLWNDLQGNMPKYIAFLKEFLSFDEEAERLAGSAATH